MAEDNDITITPGSGYSVPSDSQHPVSTSEPTEHKADQAAPKEAEPAPKAELVSLPENIEGSKEYQDALQHELSWRKEAETYRQQTIKEQQWANMQLQRLAAEPIPKMPSFEETYPAPSAPPTGEIGRIHNDLKSALVRYSAVALPLAFAFGLKGAASNGAANAFSTGVRALKERYYEKARVAAEVWKAQNDLAIKNGAHKMQYYKDVLQNRRLNIEEKKEQIKLMAEYWKDGQLSAESSANNWHHIVDILSKRDKLISDAKKVRAEEEDKVMKFFGADAEHKAYLQSLADKYPDIRKEMIKAIQGTPGSSFEEAYSKGIDRYPFSQFHEEHEQEKLKEIRAGAESRAQGTQAGKLPKKTTSNPLGLNLGPDFNTDAQDGSMDDLENVQ